MAKFTKMVSSNPFEDDYWIGEFDGHEIEITKIPSGYVRNKHGYRYHWATSRDGWKCKMYRDTKTLAEAKKQAIEFIEKSS